MNAEPNNAVFLSYASQDAEAAKRICDALRQAGVEVWFDQSELVGGDAWDAKIRRQIGECALFVPVVSAATQARREGYFRIEWRLAAQRTHAMSDDTAFLLPVVIDGTREAEAKVPAEFRAVQWTRLPGDGAPDKFCTRVRRLLDGPIREVGRSVGSGVPDQVGPSIAPDGDAVSPAKPRFKSLRVALAMLMAGGIALYFALRPPRAANDVAQPGTPATALRVDDKSIAVLAFDDLSPAHDSEYFSVGISDELLNALAKVPGLRVTAGTSAFSFKGSDVPIAEVAQKLRVAYLVQGSVRKSGKKVSIIAKLIKAADGFILWSEKYERDVTDVLAVQDEIVELIARRLQLKLGVVAPAAVVKTDALQLYLEARGLWNLFAAGALDQMEDRLRQVLTTEPQFAPAEAGLAFVWGTRALAAAQAVRYIPNEIGQAEAHARRALDRDPTLAEALEARGIVAWLQGRLADAEDYLRHAVSNNPNYARGWERLGWLLEREGKLDEALEYYLRARELDPLAQPMLDGLARIYIQLGQP
ncbi:MAG: TIR domain-containing protein, partial [Pseudomonadota bacterium]